MKLLLWLNVLNVVQRLFWSMFVLNAEELSGRILVRSARFQLEATLDSKLM